MGRYLEIANKVIAEIEEREKSPRYMANLILIRVPLRISFAGGSSDLQWYLDEGNEGKVISCTINKYIYILLSKRYDNQIVVGYSEFEQTDKIEQIKHDIIREGLKLFQIKNGIEIHTVADVSGKGTGLGSSSSLAIGLVKGLQEFTSLFTDVPCWQIACQIEIDILKKPIGKQDQVIADVGGWNIIKFSKDNVDVLDVSNDIDSEYWEDKLMLIDSGWYRKADNVLKEQRKDKRIDIVNQIKNLVSYTFSALVSRDEQMLVNCLHEGWQLKKQLNFDTKAGQLYVDMIYQKLLINGAIGGKVAGGSEGGSILVVTNDKKQVRQYINQIGLQEIPFKFVQKGVETIAKI